MKIRPSSLISNISLLLLLCSVSITYGQATNKINEKQLKSLLASISVWPSHFPDSNGVPYSSWKQLIAVAKDLQNREPDSLVRSFHSLQGDAPIAVPLRDATKKLETDRKLFILLRVIFELPESIPLNESERSGGWVTGRSEVNADGTINMAWPLQWNQGRPKFVCGFCGLQGPRFDASAEYNYFRERFPMRNLSQYRDSDLPPTDANKKGVSPANAGNPK
jgi:hypothetical protein